MARPPTYLSETPRILGPGRAIHRTFPSGEYTLQLHAESATVNMFFREEVLASNSTDEEMVLGYESIHETLPTHPIIYLLCLFTIEGGWLAAEPVVGHHQHQP